MGSSELQISKIEHELTRLWRESRAAQAGEPEEQPPMLRATVMNLIVSGCGEEREGLSQLLAEVTRTDPCRAIMIETDPSRAEAGGWANVLCHRIGRDQPHVCSEQIVLSAPPSHAEEVFGSVAGLLVADVPTFVWWRGRMPHAADEMERFARIVHLADRLLFDSNRCGGQGLARIAAFTAARRVPSVGDVNWTRLMRWRVELARAFDPPSARQLLASVKSVRIFYQTEQPDNASRLMAGWLRSRLGSLLVDFQHAENPSIEIHASSQVFTAPCPGLLSETEALSEELRVLGRDKVFEQALAAAVVF